MIFRIVIILLAACAADGYFFHGQHVMAALDAMQNFGPNLNHAISGFTRRLQ